MTDRELMQQALAVLGLVDGDVEWQDRSMTRKVVLKTITALRERLAQPEQEPVACRVCGDKRGSWAWQCNHCGAFDESPQPPQRTWVGLTDVEWMNIVNKDQAWFGQRPDEVAHEVAKLVEAKLKEKNT